MAEGARGLRAAVTCRLDVDCIPPKLAWQGAKCPTRILTTATLFGTPCSAPYPDLTFPIGTLNVPSGELDFWLWGLFWL